MSELSKLDIWREERRKGVGGSDAAAVLGLNPWTSPLDVYNDKMGLVNKDLSDNEAVRWGKILEDSVAKEYARRKGVKVRRRNKMFFHPEHSFMLANLDRTIDGQKKILEVKTAGAFMASQWGKEGTDQVPDSYLVQVAHYMAVMDCDVADLAVLIGGRDFRTYTIHRDAELERLLIEKEGMFWRDHIEKEIPPEPIMHHDLDTLYGNDNGLSLDAPLDIIEVCERLGEIKRQLSLLEQAKDADEFLIKKAMGENAILLDGDKFLATWKKTKPSQKFNEKVFQKENPDLYEKYRVEKEGYRRFLLKQKGEKHV